ncbi:MAG: transcriptional regulator [Bacteroidetes bacterium]|nr:transcriptional regulator [Bacteroidota bacterium]
MKGLLTFIITLWVGFYCSGQNTIGLPDIINYSKQYYKAGAQNRQIRQDKKGNIYFANSEGVLTYNGINWKTYPLSNNSIVRCVEFGPDNKLYVGGQDEFGYFSPASNGELKYHSLRDVVPKEERSFTDVWEIYFYRDWIFFQTSNKIFQVKGNHCNVYKSIHWRFISICNNRLIAQDYDKGLLTFQNGIWAPFITKSELPADYFVTSLTTLGHDSAILTTLKNGVYMLIGTEVKKLQTPFLNQVSNNNISASAMVNSNHIALTTNLDGCYIIDKNGNLVQKFSRKEGLQNNNILDIYLDREKNIWLGLDNGIDFIAYNNAVKHIYPDYLNEGSGYAADIFNNQLYIGTSNGLYKTTLYDEPDLSYVKGNFIPVENSKGQVWNLSEVNGKLLMGHHDGAFVIDNNVARQLDKSSGYWTFLPLSNVLPSAYMIAGTYQGINFFKYVDGSFSKDTSTFAYFESARFVCIDNDKIWIAHPYKGIYRVQLLNGKTVTKTYAKAEGIISPNGNYVFKIKNTIVLATENGLFEYNTAKDAFEPSVYFNQLFPGKKIRYLKEDNAGNIWFVFDKIIGVVDMSGAKPQTIYFPELTNKFVSGFEQVYPVDKNNVFIGGERGFYHINFEQYKKIKYPLQVQITSVKMINDKDSLLYGGYRGEVNEDVVESKQKKTKVNHSWNSFHFEYASTVYAQQANIEYSYYLEGFDEKWSEFSRKTEKEYTNLPAGKYVFNVKARNNLGNESAVGSYEFYVLPPWYQSYWAYALYLLIFFVGNYWLYIILKRKFRSQQLKHEEEQKQLQYLHQLEMEKNEKEIVKLRNEKLEAEIQHKNNELASVAMHLVQKGELLGKVKDQMVKLKNAPGTEKDADDFKKIIRVISEEDKIDKQWEQFAKHFDTVHSDFLTILKSKYPNLSANELKLSAYLRMNLSTKEIAQLMNISVRGVEISRYRLRKKLEIPTEMNLFNFLLNLQEGKR